MIILITVGLRDMFALISNDGAWTASLASTPATCRGSPAPHRKHTLESPQQPLALGAVGLSREQTLVVAQLSLQVGSWESFQLAALPIAPHTYT
jgi:hypothetical protein